MLSDMLHALTLTRVSLLVDTLDECDSELSRLLDLNAHNTSKPSRVKWLVSSRNGPDIEEQLRRTKISLKLNSCHILQTVNAFIDFKVQELTEQNNCNSRLHKEVKGHLCRNTEGTFLWVALVCKQLRQVPLWETPSTLEGLPPRLELLYVEITDI
jgi:hypothetical protein